MCKTAGGSWEKEQLTICSRATGNPAMKKGPAGRRPILKILKQAEEKGVNHVTPQVKRAGPEGQPFFCLAADAELADDGLVTGLFDLLEIVKKRTTL